MIWESIDGLQTLSNVSETLKVQHLTHSAQRLDVSNVQWSRLNVIENPHVKA